MGTYNLIDCARRHWIEKPGVPKSGFESARFHHVSTDEVFGSLDVDGYFNENTPYNPKNPYSASKAGSDFIVKSFAHTYGMNTVVTNCSNNYGPWQNNEKLIPTIISKAISGKEIPIYGDGSNIRDWLHVTNHCYAIDKVFHQGANNETYNVGTWNEVSNLDLAQKICEILDDVKGKNNGVSYKDQIRFVADRPGHDRRYAIDASKLEKELGYSAKMSFDEGLKETIQWYLNRSNTCENTL
jgi:dTDP-glucose 4,6-dehydratase